MGSDQTFEIAKCNQFIIFKPNPSKLLQVLCTNFFLVSFKLHTLQKIGAKSRSCAWRAIFYIIWGILQISTDRMPSWAEKCRRGERDTFACVIFDESVIIDLKSLLFYLEFEIENNYRYRLRIMVELSFYRHSALINLPTSGREKKEKKLSETRDFKQNLVFFKLD